MANMTLGDKLKFIVTGKRPEEREDDIEEKAEDDVETNSNSFLQGATENTETLENPEISENVFEEHAEKSHIEKNDTEKKEAQFLAKTGMTLKKAESLLQKWEKAGELAKCAKGASLIAEFFPKHESQKFLKKSSPKGKVLSSKKKKIGKSDFTKKLAKNPLEAVGISYNHGEENLPDENENDDTERLWSALSYIPFASVFVIMTQQESKFTMYHAYQALALLFLSILVGTFGYVFSFIGMGFVAGFIHFFIFIMSIFAGFTALNGRYITIPFISGMAKTLSGRK